MGRRVDGVSCHRRTWVLLTSPLNHMERFGPKQSQLPQAEMRALNDQGHL